MNIDNKETRQGWGENGSIIDVVLSLSQDGTVTSCSLPGPGRRGRSSADAGHQVSLPGGEAGHRAERPLLQLRLSKRGLGTRVHSESRFKNESKETHKGESKANQWSIV